MEYFKSREERVQNLDGSIKEIFIAVRLTKDSDVWEQGYWLTEEEKSSVLADEQALTPIIDKVAVMGEIALANYKSQPVVEN